MLRNIYTAVILHIYLGQIRHILHVEFVRVTIFMRYIKKKIDNKMLPPQDLVADMYDCHTSWNCRCLYPHGR